MSSFTIHNIDAELDLELTAISKKRKVSKNRLIKELLATSLGLSSDNRCNDDYSEFCGLWSAEKQEEFNTIQGTNEVIDAEEWNR